MAIAGYRGHKANAIVIDSKDFLRNLEHACGDIAKKKEHIACWCHKQRNQHHTLPTLHIEE